MRGVNPNYGDVGKREAARLARLEKENPAKAAHQRILDRINKRLSRAWYDRLCSWCGREYNTLDEGTRRDHCSDECFEADKFAAETAIRNSKPKSYRREIRARWDRKVGTRSKEALMKEAFNARLAQLLRGTEPGQWISALEAARAMGIKKENAFNWLDKFVEAGIARERRTERIRTWVLDRTHPRCEEALK